MPRISSSRNANHSFARDSFISVLVVSLTKNTRAFHFYRAVFCFCISITIEQILQWSNFLKNGLTVTEMDFTRSLNAKILKDDNRNIQIYEGITSDNTIQERKKAMDILTA